MIKIKKEKFPEKCEICHQKDFFDPPSNVCTRCNKLIIAKSDKGKFVINWQVDLALLANTLRNFAWQNLDSKLMQIVRLILVASMFFLIFAPIIDQPAQYYYYSTSLPVLPYGEGQTEDFTYVCGGHYPITLECVQVGLLFTSVIGLFIGLAAYYSPENEKDKLINLSR